MAFNIGYVGLCNRNIKHIYTTTDIKQPATRKPVPYKPDFLREQERERQDKQRNRRFMQYYPMHDIELPKALSYRTLPQKNVDEMVSRLMKKSTERFNFKFSYMHDQQDWRQARQEKLRRLHDVMAKFGAPSHRPEPELETGVYLNTDLTVEKKTKKRKVKGGENGPNSEKRRQSLKEKSDYVEQLPPLK